MLRPLILCLFLIALLMPGCASSDDIKGAADAANRAAGGEASGSAGSKAIDLVAGVSQTGDIQNEAWKVSAQRNVSNTAAGSTYAAVSMASGGGAEALQRAIASDPIIALIKVEIAKADTGAPEMAARMDALRAELTARVTSLTEASQRQSTPAVVHDVYQIVLSPSALGRDQPGITAEDTIAAQQIAEAIRAGKNQSAKPPAPPTTQPVQ